MRPQMQIRAGFTKAGDLEFQFERIDIADMYGGLRIDKGSPMFEAINRVSLERLRLFALELERMVNGMLEEP